MFQLFVEVISFDRYFTQNRSQLIQKSFLFECFARCFLWERKRGILFDSPFSNRLRMGNNHIKQTIKFTTFFFIFVASRLKRIDLFLLQSNALIQDVNFSRQTFAITQQIFLLFCQWNSRSVEEREMDGIYLDSSEKTKYNWIKIERNSLIVTARRCFPRISFQSHQFVAYSIQLWLSRFFTLQRCIAFTPRLLCFSDEKVFKFTKSSRKIHFQAKQRTKIRLIFNSPISLRCRLFISESFRCASKQSSYRFCISSNSFCNFFAFSISFSKFVRSCWHTLSNVWKSSTAEIFCSACKVFIVWKRSHFNLPWSVTIIDSYFM